MLDYNTQQGHFLVDGHPINLSHSEIEEMNSYEWWHSIPFAPGLSSKGFCKATQFISHYLLDTIDFKGKSVLDIGCWDGFQLFYAEAKGASRIVGVDDLTQRHMGDRARGFAKRKLNSKVEFVDMNVYDLSTDAIGTFDIVMMFGVLYHLVHPMLGIEKACGVCKSEFLIASHFIPSDDPFPWCLLYPDRELEGDHSNWSGPNKAWIQQALKIQGFNPSRENQYAADRITFYAARGENHHSTNGLLNAHRKSTLLS